MEVAKSSPPLLDPSLEELPLVTELAAGTVEAVVPALVVLVDV